MNVYNIFVFVFIQIIITKLSKRLVTKLHPLKINSLHYVLITHCIIKLLTNYWISVAASAYAVDKLGRRPLLIISCTCCGIALFAEGFYFYLQDYLKADVSNIGWLPVAGVMVYIVMNPVGLNTVPYIVQGEIFPTNIKAIGSSVSTFYSGMNAFIVSKSFQPVSKMLGMYSTFWIFSAFCFSGVLFAIYVLPETKGKSFVEIQENLQNKKNKTSVIQLT